MKDSNQTEQMPRLTWAVSVSLSEMQVKQSKVSYGNKDLFLVPFPNRKCRQRKMRSHFRSSEVQKDFWYCKYVDVGVAYREKIYLNIHM